MQKRKEKKKKRIRLFPIMIILIGSVGWYYTKTIEGTIITIIGFSFLLLVFKLWRGTSNNRRLKRAGIREIDEMSGEEFEQFLGFLFEKRGFKVSYTKASGDYGADLILTDRDEVIAVQAKRYSGTVGVKAVQEISGALKMYEATQGWVVTNSYFTKQAEKLAESNEVYLIDRDELIDMILKKR
ncbi:restriction endonuclease [Lysinibacillus sp. PLM2]|nr:restriction endonuclease [Lysinibacillus sp. PLM2]